jgi:hypothetical protein
MRPVIAVLLGSVLFAISVQISAAAGGKCTSLQARCAVEVGGRCDPNTGSWCYGWWKGQRCGSGTIQAYDACVSRGSAKR